MESTHLKMSSLLYQSSTSDEEEIISITVTPSDVTTTTVNEINDSNTSLILTVVLLPVMGSFIMLLIVTVGCYCIKIQLSKGIYIYIGLYE